MKKIISWTKDKLKNLIGNFLISPNILDHFGLSSYNSIRKCLVELCSNSYDADANEVKIYLPTPNDRDSIIIEDNGCGMTAEQFKNEYLYIARNRRTTSGEKTKLGRKVIGNKGIGKLAGFGISEIVKIETVSKGIATTVNLKREDFNIQKSINTSKIKIETHTAKNNITSGTRVTLKKLKNNIKIPEESFLRRYLRNHLPKHENFTIFVNDIKCTAEDIPGETHHFTENIDSIGKQVSGFYTITSSNTSEAGLSVRVRGRIVKKPGFFNLNLDSFTSRLSRRFVGEINADFMDEEGSHSLINTSRNGFIEDDEIVESFNDWVREFIKSKLKEEAKKSITSSEESIFNSPVIKSRINKLPQLTQNKARKTISIIVKKLDDKDEDVSLFVDFILKYYESNFLRELFDSIMAANEKHVEQLAEMISEWGIREIAGIIDIVTQQIKIIKKLEILVNDPNTPEKTIHKIFEKNIWLLDEKYKLWASDKQLKNILDGEIDKQYKKEEQRRPDIICRTNDKKAVIIEFKRPSKKINLDHLTQTIRYRTIIKTSMVNLEEITIYIIGKEYAQEVIDNKELQSKAGNFCLSFSEVLSNAQRRFEKILKIIEGEDI